MLENIINGIFAISVCIILIIASVFVGTPLEENTRIITETAVEIFVIYIIIYKVVLKKKYKEILKNIHGLDIGVFILCLSPFIPIIFKTYANFEDSFNIAIRYLGVLTIYVLSRLLMMQNFKYKKYFCNAIIITGIISAIIGIDDLTADFFREPLDKIGIPLFANSENRMFGNFGYANTFAMSLTLPLILSLDNYVKKEKRNVVYIGINFIYTVCIILSYSRATFFIILIGIILYCILQKNITNTIKIINTISILVIIGMLYSKIFTDYYLLKDYLVIWGGLLICMIICMILVKLLNKFVLKISAKRYILIIATMFILVVLVIVVGLQLDKPLHIFENKTQRNEILYIIKDIEPEKYYKIEFEIEAKSEVDSNIYLIQVIERNKQNQQVLDLNHKIRLGNFSGTKTVEFTANSETDSLYIMFTPLRSNKQQGLTINKLTINDEEYKLDYLYLPEKLVNRIQSLDIEGFLNTGRITFYKDAFKLIAKNPWTGIGGNGWNYKYEEVASFGYKTKQVHSYPVQIFLEFGIVAIISYITILIFIANYSKHMYKEDCGVLVATIAIFMHSMIDFDLSFLNMLLYTFVLISIISSNKKSKTS